jgi:hypothetical protein
MINTQIETVVFTYGSYYIRVTKDKEINFALNKPQKKAGMSAVRIFSTALLAASLCAASDFDKGGSLNVAEPISLEEYSSGKATEPYVFLNRDEVTKFISNRNDIKELLKSLPVMTAEVLGEAKMSLSVFTDFEENWKNLRVEIETNHSIEEFGLLEDKLFALFEENKIPDSALADVTISFV